ncbi:formimidoylglutamate deiminase [Roseovarius sp. SCSIO 43702]|uniref:formimidoylglutamate deiminase n=1 Tax=Roseovarius sp. SCSIO 43702 TaxID=2823043 RepID=UPI001C73CF68|nr:formimidoylglutamate deiminase [Roseovarius sp. SCSIO 43702]QYX57664.1 formimidoylglutamate deiminase [Roseovarius sp. SCSIO 43702]
MTVLWAERALTSEGWARDVRLEIGEDGRIAGLATGAAPEGQRLGVLLPAPANSHSHAFQRAMAGLTETRGDDPTDSFWTWRQLMYRFLDRITPDQVQAIAALVQMEMLEAGFATNVEFHYLHHRPDGTPYDRLSEMADRIAAAQAVSGIGLTLLPVLYQYGGCDRRALGPGQRRFGNDPDRFARLVEETGETLRHLPADARLGVAPHSLRAVAPDAIRAAADLVPGGPVHMHLAEQQAEVDEVEAAWGARPVTWALSELELDPRWCLIHCTQMTPDETMGLARTGAVAGLCPITEASLGDGIFDGVRWMEADGCISVGSDSNILISLHEELRLLDTSQRLRDHTRAALARPGISTGRRLFESVARGGAQAAGRGTGMIETGAWADLLALDTSHVDLAGIEGDTILDTFVFAGRDAMVADVWSAGRHMVHEGQHMHRVTITRAYAEAVADLRAQV